MSTNVLSPAQPRDSFALSPNSRRFGLDGNSFKGLGEGLAKGIAAIALAAIGIGYLVGKFANRATFTALGATITAIPPYAAAAGVVATIAIGIIIYQMIKSKA